jgi:hypothetical protein
MVTVTVRIAGIQCDRILVQNKIVASGGAILARE